MLDKERFLKKIKYIQGENKENENPQSNINKKCNKEIISDKLKIVLEKKKLNAEKNFLKIDNNLNLNSNESCNINIKNNQNLLDDNEIPVKNKNNPVDKKKNFLNSSIKFDSNYDKIFKYEDSKNINSTQDLKLINKTLLDYCHDSLRDNFILDSKSSFNSNDLFEAPKEVKKNKENSQLSEYIFLKKKLSREDVSQIENDFLDKNGKLRNKKKSNKTKEKPIKNQFFNKKDLHDISHIENLVQESNNENEEVNRNQNNFQEPIRTSYNNNDNKINNIKNKCLKNFFDTFLSNDDPFVNARKLLKESGFLNSNIFKKNINLEDNGNNPNPKKETKKTEFYNKILKNNLYDILNLKSEKEKSSEKLKVKENSIDNIVSINKKAENRIKPFDEKIYLKIKKNFLENSYYNLQKGFECKNDSKSKSNFNLNSNSVESIKSKKILKKRKLNEENKENINLHLNNNDSIQEEEKMQISEKSNNNHETHKYSEKNCKESYNDDFNKSLFISDSKMQISENKMEFNQSSEKKNLDKENIENIINLEIPVRENMLCSENKISSNNFELDNNKDLKEFEYLSYFPREKQILFAINNLCNLMNKEQIEITDEDFNSRNEHILYSNSSLNEKNPSFINLKENSNLPFKNCPSLIYKNNYSNNRIELERKMYNFKNLQKNLHTENTLNFFRNSNFSYLKNYSNKRKTINLEIIKSNVSLNSISTSFIITSDGLASSQRSKNNEYISIGRQQINDDGIRPNDIMLFPTDPSISRSHFKILYKSFFLEQTLFFEKLQILLNIIYINNNHFAKYPKTYFETINTDDDNFNKEFYNYFSNYSDNFVDKIKPDNVSKLINLENKNHDFDDTIEKNNYFYNKNESLFLDNCFETKENIKNNSYSLIKDNLTISQKQKAIFFNEFKNLDENKYFENEFIKFDYFHNSKYKKMEIPNYLKKLSPTIIYDIVKYLVPRQVVFIEDNSTIYGTYVRVKPFSIDNLINNIFLIYKTLNIYYSMNNFNFENSLHIILNNQKEFKNVATELFKNISYDKAKLNNSKYNTQISSLNNSNLNEISIKLDLNNKIIIGDCNLENYFFYNLENLNLLKNLRMKYLYNNMDMNHKKFSRKKFEESNIKKKINNKREGNHLVELNNEYNRKKNINSNFSFLDSERNNVIEIDENFGISKQKNNSNSKEFNKCELSEFEILQEKFKKFTLEKSNKEYRFSYDFNFGKPYDYLINKLSEEEKHLQEYKYMINPNIDDVIHFPSYFRNLNKRSERVNNKNLEKELFLLFLNKKKIDFLLKNFQNESFNPNNKDSLLKIRLFKNMNNSSEMSCKCLKQENYNFNKSDQNLNNKIKKQFQKNENHSDKFISNKFDNRSMLNFNTESFEYLSFDPNAYPSKKLIKIFQNENNIFDNNLFIKNLEFFKMHIGSCNRKRLKNTESLNEIFNENNFTVKSESVFLNSAKSGFIISKIGNFEEIIKAVKLEWQEFYNENSFQKIEIISFDKIFNFQKIDTNSREFKGELEKPLLINIFNSSFWQDNKYTNLNLIDFSFLYLIETSGDPCGIMNRNREFIFAVSKKQKIENQKLFAFNYRAGFLLGNEVNCSVFNRDWEAQTFLSFDVFFEKWIVSDLTCFLKPIIYYSKDYHGLWMCISPDKRTINRFSPRKYPVKTGDEIKISETIMTVNLEYKI